MPSWPTGTRTAPAAISACTFWGSPCLWSSCNTWRAYYTGPVLQGLIPCLLGCGVGLVISYPLARKIGEASFQRLLAIVIGLSGFSILTRALLDS